MKNFGETLLRLAFMMICAGLLVLCVWCLPLDQAPIVPMFGSLGLTVFGILFVGVRVLLGQDHCEHCKCESCREENENDISLPLFVKDVNLPKDVDKEEVVGRVGVALAMNGFTPRVVDKPWGIEFKIQENQAMKFLETFFEKSSQLQEILLHPVGPKILVIEEFKRLSWHVHERKDAYLRVLRGKVDVYVSWSDAESQPTTAIAGELIGIPPLLRHRLGSKDGWAVIAEISRNVDPNHPSDDSDERRIADDFGRE